MVELVIWLHVRLLATAFAAMNFQRIFDVCKSDQSMLYFGVLDDLLVRTQVLDFA